MPTKASTLEMITHMSEDLKARGGGASQSSQPCRTAAVAGKIERDSNLTYLLAAQNVFDSVEDIVIGISAGILLTSLQCRGSLTIESELAMALATLREHEEILHGTVVPSYRRHEHCHLLTALQNVRQAIAAACSVPNMTHGGADRIIAWLNKAAVELKRFDRTLPGYRLVGGCSCEVVRVGYAEAIPPADS